MKNRVYEGIITSIDLIVIEKEVNGLRKPAQLYQDELKCKFIEEMYNIRNQYYSGWTGFSIPTISDNNYESHDFVCLGKHRKIIGYIGYNVYYTNMMVDKFGIISFDKGNLEFVKDVYDTVIDIFIKYNMNRLEWLCYIDNPAIRGYRRFANLFGGIQNGYYRDSAKLMDGQLHDSVSFEILREDFLKSEGWLKHNERVQRQHKRNLEEIAKV